MAWKRLPRAVALSVGLLSSFAPLAAHGDWTTYHRDLMRSGFDAAQPPFTSVVPDWTSAALDGDIYAQPVVLGDRVFVATEGDTVYALNAASGAISWQSHLGTPVPGSEPPCGNIDPIGITSTPVVDPVAGVLYTVAFLQPAHHELYALSVDTGAIRWHRAIDPPGADPLLHNQRGSLALSQGRVYVPYGGRLGDCGNYHGWVVATNADGSGNLLTYQVPTTRMGGIWAPSGPAVDAAGNVFVATGNSESTTEFDHGNSVIRLSPQLSEQDFFAPINWAELNALDVDLGSVGPALLEGGLVFQVGKEGVGYLLQANALGGIGGELFADQVCLTGGPGAGAFGGTAHTATMVYVPCTDGLVALTVSGNTFTVAWRSGPFFAGPPIVSGGAVWTIGRDGLLIAFDATSGEGLYLADLGTVTHFASPASSGRRIFAPAGRQIVTFLLL